MREDNQQLKVKLTVGKPQISEYLGQILKATHTSLTPQPGNGMDRLELEQCYFDLSLERIP